MLTSLLGATLCLLPQQPEVAWKDARELTVEGQGWTDTKAPYDRLPKVAEGVVRQAVWDLSRSAAGICVGFTTDSRSVHARWTLTSERLAMNHMPATGVSGVDLYVKHEGQWRWLGTGRPSKRANTARLVSELPREPREFRLYLPLYNGVSSVEIGVDADAKLTKGQPRAAAASAPIVFYGTSITQGGCASRPGMAHVAILGRRLDRPVINLGFSGNGRMEIELADLVAEVDAAVYVLDCLPNMTEKLVRERAAPFVRRLRERRPTTPILLVEDRSYASSFLIAKQRQRNEGNRKALRETHQQLLETGVTGLVYLEGDRLLGADGDDTVDGSHPTDLGFARQADAFEAVLAPLFEQ